MEQEGEKKNLSWFFLPTALTHLLSCSPKGIMYKTGTYIPKTNVDYHRLNNIGNHMNLSAIWEIIA